MSRLLVPLVLLVLLVGHADAAPERHMRFRPDARLDTSQVEDRRGVRLTCIWVGGAQPYCTEEPLRGGCASSC